MTYLQRVGRGIAVLLVTILILFLANWGIGSWLGTTAQLFFVPFHLAIFFGIAYLTDGWVRKK